jgi:hypothetical protein
MADQKRFGPGERVRYCMDWPDLPDPTYTVAAGSCATVVLVPPGSREMYMVRLDEAIPSYGAEMSVAGRYLELEPEPESARVEPV